MRRSANIILLSGMILFFLAILLSMFHMRSIGRVVMIATIALFTVGLLIRLFTPVTAARWQNFTRAFYKWHSFSHKLIDLGGLVLCGYAICKFCHIKGVSFLAPTGLIIYILGLISLYVLFKIKNRYIIDSDLDKVLSNDDLEKYTGLYKNDELKMQISVKVIDGYLVGQANDQSAYRLSAVKEHIFNYLPWKLVMEFHPEKSEFILIQHGGYFPFAKIA